jgi:hypothetical protein
MVGKMVRIEGEGLGREFGIDIGLDLDLFSINTFKELVVLGNK